jgi:hypothetical protein
VFFIEGQSDVIFRNDTQKNIRVRIVLSHTHGRLPVSPSFSKSSSFILSPAQELVNENDAAGKQPVCLTRAQAVQSAAMSAYPFYD